MTAIAPAVAAVVGITIAGLGVAIWGICRAYEAVVTRIGASAQGAIDLVQAQLNERTARVAELEHMLDSYHAKALGIATPPAPRRAQPTIVPLPPAIVKFLEGFDEPEVRDQYEGEFRRLLAAEPEADPDQLITRVTVAALNG